MSENEDLSGSTKRDQIRENNSEESQELGPLSDELGWWRRGCIARVLKGKHCLVIGETGSGKSFWMAHVANRYLSRFIFVNPQLEEVVEQICTTHYDEVEEVLEGIRAKETKIEFIPNVDTKIALEQLKELREGLFQIAEEIGIHSGQFWVNFILDETQTWAWKGAHTDIDSFATRGRRFGIRSFFVTQRPQNVSSTIINNVDTQIVFLTGLYESVYFRNYHIPIDEHEEWLKKKYHYILFDRHEVKECPPI